MSRQSQTFLNSKLGNMRSGSPMVGPTVRNSAILHVLFFLGPRVSEVVALNVGDIVADGEYTVMKLTIKGGQAHRVPAPPEALAAVNEYLAMSGHTKGAMFRRIKGGNSRLTRLSTCRSITSLPRLRSDQQLIISVRIQPGPRLPLNHWRMVRYLSMCSLHWGMRILRRPRCMTGARLCTGIRLLCGFGMVKLKILRNFSD